MSCWEWFVQQMGRDKALITFDYEALAEDYVPYGAWKHDLGKYPEVDINYVFSEATWANRVSNFYDIYTAFPPNMDVSRFMDMGVIA